MQEKYIISKNLSEFDVEGGQEQVIVLKFNPKENLLVIGGKLRFDSLMHEIMIIYLKARVPEKEYTQRNKVRYHLSCSQLQFQDLLERLRDEYFDLYPTKNCGTIMR